ncbi:Ig-like domain-containing protein [Flagellimonas marinaquae]
MYFLRSTAILLIAISVFYACSSDSTDPAPEPDTIAPTLDFTISGTSISSSPIVVGDQMEINISAEDAKGIDKVEAFIDNEKVGEDTSSPFNIIVDLSVYTAKSLTKKSQNYTLRVDAIDTSGNTSSLEQTITIVTEKTLVTINIPETYNDPNLIEFYLFASTMEGQLLGVKKVEPTDSSITVSTLEDISENEPFMLTLAKLTPYGAQFSTIGSITSSLLPEINLESYPLFENYTGTNTFQASGYEDTEDDILHIFGNRYLGSWNPSNPDIVTIDRFNCIDCSNPSTDSLYLVKRNLSTNDYKYLTTAWDIDGDEIISFNDFTDIGVEKKEIQINNASSQSNAYFNYRILGYFNESDFEDNFYHHVDTGLGSSITDNKINYYYNEIFENFAFELSLGNYYTYQTNLPPSTIFPLDWTLDYSLDERTISIQKNSADDILGKITLGTTIIDEDYIPYRWELIFNSQEITAIPIPELPEAIKSWEFYEAFSTSPLQVGQVEIKKYKNIVEYDDYIRKVIANNQKAYLISDKIESIFIATESDYHITTDDWLID